MKNRLSMWSVSKWSALAVVCAAANAGGAWAQAAVEEAPTDDAAPISRQESTAATVVGELPEGLDSIVAIDPVNAPLVRGTPSTADERGATANEVQAQRSSGRGILPMPDGIKSITSIDAFNELLVQTTGEGETEVQTRANPLIAPIRQVRFDVRVIEMPAATDTKGDAEGATASRSIDKSEIEAQLSLGTARVVQMGRMIVPHNQKGNLHWESTTPATIRTQNDKGAPLLQSTNLTDALSLSVQPVVGSDGTIAFRMHLSSGLISEGKKPLTGFSSTTLSESTATTEARIKMGESFVSGAFPSNLEPNKKFTILPFGTVFDVDAPVEATTAAPKNAAREIYIEITATFATPQTPDATK